MGIHLLGEPGTGKTYAAAALGRELYEAGAYVRFVHMPGESSSSLAYDKEHGATYTPHEMPFSPDTKEQGVVILDDLNGSELHRNKFFRVIDVAYRVGGIVIATSNYTDPMFYKNRPPEELDPISKLLEQVTGETFEPDRTVQDIEDARMYSRIGGMMLPLVLEADIDLRGQTSPWNEF